MSKTNKPFTKELEAGKTYYWCACGLSQSQPFCDGSHKSTDITPIAYTAEKKEVRFFCGCKRSEKAPFCDGSHNHPDS